MFAPTLTKRISVDVNGSASGYNRAMVGATAATGNFKVGVGAAMAAVVLLGVKMGAASVNAFANFQYAMTKVRTISRATTKEFAALSKEAEHLGKVTQFTMVQIADGMTVFARAGKAPAEIIKMMAGTTALAVSQDIDLADAAKIVTDVMNAMHMQVIDTNDTVNLLAAASSSASLDINLLYEALVPIMPTAYTLGIGLGDLSAMIGLLANVGLKGTKATTTLRTSIARLADPAGTARKKLAELGVEIFDMNGNFVGTAQLLGDLHNAYAGLSPEMQLYNTSIIFGKRAMTNWQALIDKGGSKLAELSAEITDTNTAFQQQADMMDTLAGKKIISTSSVDALKTALGEVLAPVIEKFIVALTKIINYTTDWINGNNTLLETLRNIADVLGRYVIPFPLGIQYDDPDLSPLENEAKNLQRKIDSLVANPFKGSDDIVATWKRQLVDLQNEINGISASNLTDAGLAAAVAFKSAREDVEAMARAINGIHDFGGLNLGISDLSLSGLAPGPTPSFIPGALPGDLQFGKVPDALKTLQERLDAINMSMSAEGIFDALKLLSIDFPDSLADIVKKGESVSDALRDSAANILALADGDTELIARAAALIAKADILDARFGKAADAVSTFSDKLNEIRGYLSQIPGVIGEVTTAMVDLVQSIQSSNWSGVVMAIANIITAVMRESLRLMQEKLADLNDQLTELKKTEAFFIDAMATIGNTISDVASVLGDIGPGGAILSAAIEAIAGSFAMLTLEGIDLLNAGLATLSTLISSMASIFMDFIQRSDAYQAVQEQSTRAWKAISDLFGQFLWPLAALLKTIMDWLGIQNEVNSAAMREVGVPSTWKRSRAAYESASPGQVIEGGGVDEIPAWATAIVQDLAKAIEDMLEGMGISSWDDLLKKFKDGAIKFWNYVNTKIPELIKSIKSVVNSLEEALGGNIIDTIVGWLKKGVDWLINDLPAFINKAIDFAKKMWEAIVAVYNWGVDLWNEAGGWTGILAKWDEFKETLGTLPSWTDLQAEMAKLIASIAGVEAAIKGVEAAIRLLSIVAAIAAAALTIVQTLGGVGALISGIGSLFSGGAAAAGTAAAATTVATTTGAAATTAATATGAAATVAAISGTPAQIARLISKGPGAVAGAAALASVPVMVGTGAFDPVVQGVVKPWLDKHVAPTMNRILKPVGDVISGVARGVAGVVGGIGSAIGGFFHAIGFAGGGFVTSPTFAKIGEAGNAEGVFPLTQNTFDRFAQGIVASLTARTPVYAGASAGQAPMITNEFHVYIGEEEVTDLVVVKVGDRSRSLTGNRSSMAALNRRG